MVENNPGRANVLGTGKVDMLARMRTALGRSAASIGPAALPPFVGCNAVSAQESLVARFRHEVELVGARAEHVSSPEGIREYLQSLLSANACSTVAVSDGSTLCDLKLFEWLGEQGMEIVPSLGEFATGKPAPRKGSLFQGHEKLRVERYKTLLLSAEVGVTSADYAIAETGTLVLASGGEQHRLISLLPPIHVCLLKPSQIIANLAGILPRLRDTFLGAVTFPKAVTLITGPSCTADIEQTLTMGMHGPRELHILFYEPTALRAFG